MKEAVDSEQCGGECRSLTGKSPADIDDVLIVEDFKVIDIAEIFQAIVFGLLHVSPVNQLEHQFPEIFRGVDAPAIKDRAGQHAVLLLSVESNSLHQLLAGDMAFRFGQFMFRGNRLTIQRLRIAQGRKNERVGVGIVPSCFLRFRCGRHGWFMCFLSLRLEMGASVPSRSDI